jgi:ABC-type glycerol-3-phosphate transport system substrate-binding protein
MSKINRRSFLKAAALGVAGAVGSEVLGNKYRSINIIARAQKRTFTITTIPGGQADRFNLLGKNFMAANPDVEVVVNVAGGAETEYKPAFPQIVASDDKPDFAWYWVDGRQYQDIANAGLLEPLDDLYESEGWNKVIPESTLRLYTQPDGKKYAVNGGIVWYPQVYYSLDAFEKAGVEPPPADRPYWTSMDEFYAACDKLRTAGYEPLTIGGKEGWIIGHAHDTMLARVATDEQLTDLLFNWRKGSTPLTRYTDAEGPWRKANQLLLDMANKKVFAEGFLARSYAEGRALFVQGKAAMYQDGSWAPTPPILYAEAPDLKFGWMLYPQVDPNISAKFLLYAGDGLMIPAGTQNVDLAKQFLAFMMSKEQVIAQISVGIVPSRTDIPATELAAAGQHTVDMFPMLPKLGTTTGWDDPVPADMAERSHFLWQDLLAGRIPVEKVGEEIEQLAERKRN